ncbi:hypothetical protein [Kineosporia babensis]|uniref:Uncharacterized protein n=1 Tax=Kineosporia babensis TaxID=499548 RepID=A0A9X1NBP3_9ACTN|nr:hypothetical protein [Kineosporia babensis]MCD5310341.1 hypothetical protein [Kineosporia babensis]
MNVNALFAGWEEAFVTDMAGLRIDGIQESFRRGFAKSLDGQITLRDYERRPTGSSTPRKSCTST